MVNKQENEGRRQRQRSSRGRLYIYRRGKRIYLPNALAQRAGGV